MKVKLIWGTNTFGRENGKLENESEMGERLRKKGKCLTEWRIEERREHIKELRESMTTWKLVIYWEMGLRVYGVLLRNKIYYMMVPWMKFSRNCNMTHENSLEPCSFCCHRKYYSLRFKIHVHFGEIVVTKKPNKFCYFW